MDFVGHARYADLDFNAPISTAHAREAVASLRPLTGATVVDLGCGWAELLLRILEEEPSAQGFGVDRDAAGRPRP